jgi:hypothetical protein
MSGYIDDPSLREQMVGASAGFIQKPLNAERLTSKVREMLDTPHPASRH